MRIELEPAFILHSHAYKETSMLVYALTEQHGIVHMVSKGAKRNGKNNLQPFMKMNLSWSGRGELYTLTNAELEHSKYKRNFRAHVQCFYLHELILRLMPKLSPAPELFQLYEQTIQAMIEKPEREDILRNFEIHLLDIIGHPLQLKYDYNTDRKLQPTLMYRYDPDLGPTECATNSQQWNIVSGSLLCALDVKNLNEQTLLPAKRFLRGLMQHYLHGKQQVRLGVNLDHVTTLRQARNTPYPDLIEAIRISEASGADGITMHLREDRRHIQDNDVYASKEVITTSMNLEMAATSEMQKIAIDVQPDHCCVVPERREELTTEGGLNVTAHHDRLKDLVMALSEASIIVSLFIEPNPLVIDAAKEVGAPVIELHTGHYAGAHGAHQQHEFERLQVATSHALQLGLTVNAGHGLHVGNVKPVADIVGMNELNIGHAIVSDALFAGLATAITNMRKAMDGESV